MINLEDPNTKLLVTQLYAKARALGRVRERGDVQETPPAVQTTPRPVNRRPEPTNVRKLDCRSLFGTEPIQQNDATGQPCNCSSSWLRECERFGTCRFSDCRGEEPCCINCDFYDRKYTDGIYPEMGAAILAEMLDSPQTDWPAGWEDWSVAKKARAIRGEAS